jgi:aryl-alcohol dehydrogenase-like predicted oxidoreductase
MAEIGLDYRDLYLIHAPWPWDEVGKDCREENRQIWKAMEEFLASGRVKAIGVSNFGPEDLDSLLPACETKPLVNQIRWFIGLDPSDTVQKCAEHDIVVEAYSPFAHGLIVNHPEIGDIARATASAHPSCASATCCKRVPWCCPRRPRPRTSGRTPNSTSRFLPPTWPSSTPCGRDTERHEDAMEFRWK